jgi:Lar family restriction alleviation protein
MKPTQLKPCPFCGGVAKLSVFPCDETASINCTKCRAGFGKRGPTAKRRVIAAWNRRAAQ